ncbi:hypothetical protein [Anaeromyxobacter diazotrophicus]|uniref:hypothetical protein n=1 Tax=Anaeromyxobacter diazotrophicus TaxID=2590199 RepID=UPI0015905347|nr:hypothetical protein [Anaeromyxobacter diazotrophicus]
MTAPAASHAPGRLGEALRAVCGLVAVVAAAALALAVLDAVPSWVAGDARDVRRARTVDEVQRRLRTRLVLPAYFPARLAWPPQRIRYLAGPPGAVGLWVDARGGAPALLLAQTLGRGELPERLVPPAQELDRSPIQVGAAQGRLARVVEDGEVRWQLTWEQGGRSLLLRSRGSVEELVRMARSARETP